MAKRFCKGMIKKKTHFFEAKEGKEGTGAGVTDNEKVVKGSGLYNYYCIIV